jgi:hypothetical protein
MMTFRVAGAVIAALAAIGVFGWFSMLASDDPPVSEIAQGRWREVFWLGVFAFVMTTSVWVAIRRQVSRLQMLARVRR